MLSSTERSRDLLYAHLSSSQRRDFIQKGYFDCKGSVTGRAYRIHVRSIGHYIVNPLDYLRNVHRVVFGWSIGSYCSQPDYAHPVPEYDRLLTQKLAIEANETYFLENAEFHLDENFAVTAAGFVGVVAVSLVVLIL